MFTPTAIVRLSTCLAPLEVWIEWANLEQTGVSMLFVGRGRKVGYSVSAVLSWQTEALAVSSCEEFAY